MRTSSRNVMALGFLVLVLFGAALRAYRVDYKTFWDDEALGTMHAFGYTEAEIVRASGKVTSAAAMQRFLRLPENDSLKATVASLAVEDPQHPPLYYAFEHLWVRLFGPSVGSIRSLSVLFGVLALPCAFWFARELFGERRSAAIFTLLVALSPLFVLYSQEAREYSLWTVTTLLTCNAFLAARRAGGFANWVLFGSSVALSLYVYPLSALVALGCGFYVLLFERANLRRTFVPYLAAMLCATLAFTPWLRIMLTSSPLRTGMEGIANANLRPGQIVFVFLRNVRSAFFDFGTFGGGRLSSSLNAALLLAAVALVAYALLFLVRHAPRDVWGFILVALCAPFVLLVARDLTGHGRFVYQARYFIPLLLGLQLAVAYTFARKLALEPPAWFWRGALAAVLAGEAASCLVSSAAATWWNKDYERSPQVAALVNATPHALVVSEYFAPSILDLSRYLRGDVPLALALKCAMCMLPDPGDGRTEPTFVAAGASDVEAFVVGIPGSAARHARWIDPRPYPPRADPLNMFEAI